MTSHLHRLLMLLLLSLGTFVSQQHPTEREQAVGSDLSVQQPDTPAAQTRDPSVSREHALFARENLVAWCVVPFDANQRGPAARAEMLRSLGFTKLAYDWRANHLGTFEEEYEQLKENGIEFFAFWDEHEEMFELCETHQLEVQFWKMIPSSDATTDDAKVILAVERLMPLVERARSLDCRVGLYNHGGWEGEPANLVAVCERLRERVGDESVGIVYNLHHGHEHLEHLEDSLAEMKPYLFCLNLNGMNENAEPKILPIGQGERDEQVMRIILESGYSGPIGILDHRPEMDAEESLRLNLEGLSRWQTPIQ